jgi:hypothetical protein
MVTKVSDLKGNNRPVDPDVKIPEAVRRAAERAEAAQREAYPDQPQQEAPKMAQPQTDKDGIKIAEPTPQPQPEPQPQSTPQPTPQPEPQPQPVTPTGNDQDTWEHKYKSAEGRRQKLEQQLAQAVDRMGAMEQMLQDIRNAPPPPPAPTTPSKLITSEEEEQFGTEMLDVMGRRAREIVSPEVAELKATVARLESMLNGTVQKSKLTAQQQMHATLTSEVPNWMEINNLNEFKAWLALPDPYSGATRHSMLLSAYAENDTPRVLAFFKGFVSELAATTPADEPVTPTPAAPQQPPKPGLESLAAPGRARTPAQTNAPAEKQIITTADINAFYAAKRRGEYAGREAEFAALEQELFKAQQEGRVRA